ncbi:MAG TPA: hypothetical protein VF980_13260 [Thermoanaerobaculia bacterium]
MKVANGRFAAVLILLAAGGGLGSESFGNKFPGEAAVYCTDLHGFLMTDKPERDD